MVVESIYTVEGRHFLSFPFLFFFRMWSIKLNYTGALFDDAKEKVRANAVADERKKKKNDNGIYDDYDDIEGLCQNHVFVPTQSSSCEMIGS